MDSTLGATAPQSSYRDKKGMLKKKPASKDNNIRNMDALTFIDFAKSMSYHVMSYNLAARTLEEKAKVEEIDINGLEFWPDINKTPLENYEYFSSSLIDHIYGPEILNSDEYESQLNELAKLL